MTLCYVYNIFSSSYEQYPNIVPIVIVKATKMVKNIVFTALEQRSVL